MQIIIKEKSEWISKAINNALTTLMLKNTQNAVLEKTQTTQERWVRQFSKHSLHYTM